MPDTEPLDLTAWLPAHFAAKWRDHPREMSLAVVVPAGPAVVAVNPPLFAHGVRPQGQR